MRSTFKISACILACVIAISIFSWRSTADEPAGKIKQQLLLQADTLIAAVKVFKATPVTVSNTRILHQRFRQVRLAYKSLEWAVEYFDPLTTRKVNGPPVPEAEAAGLVIEPDGLQVIESELFPRILTGRHAKLQGLMQRLAINVAVFKENIEKAAIQNWQILDAAKLEVFRVEALGLNNFDDPLLNNCFAESAVALQSIATVIHCYQPGIDLGPAIRKLKGRVNFDRFDRAAFITGYANPLTRQITALHHQLNLPNIRYNRLLNQDAATLFDADAFNRNAFTNAPGDSGTMAKIDLGKKLFSDPILSGSMNRSCASCHQPDKAFTDGQVKNLDITGKKMIARNTPTLINAALQPAQFYDLRAASLEDQANDVVQNKDEMHGDMKLATGKLWRNSKYRLLFSQAFPNTERTEIDTFEVMNALASYVRSLTALNSRFDQYMRGNNAAMSTAEVNGFNLFMGKAKCGTCHYLPLFNGALAPRYMQMDAEVIGVPNRKNGKAIDTDPGTFGVLPLYFNRHAFKVTTVRNASLTAPYMHNGVFKTLKEVIDFYNKGGGAGMGSAVPNQTLDAKPLKLTPKEQIDLKLFIESLNSNIKAN